MKDTSDMSQAELDLYSRICNDENDADMDDWADGHNPTSEEYIGDQD